MVGAAQTRLTRNKSSVSNEDEGNERIEPA